MGASPSDDHTQGSARLVLDIKAHCARCAAAWALMINSQTRGVERVQIWDATGAQVMDETAESAKEKFIQAEKELKAQCDADKATFQGIVDDVLGDMAGLKPEDLKDDDDS